MPCLSPILIPHPRLKSERWQLRKDVSLSGMSSPVLAELYYKTPSYYFVPCRHCVECIKKERNSWKFRLLGQLLASRNAIFCTLTFSDRYYFKKTVSIQQYVTRFLDRWRKLYGKAPKRFIVTELGEKNGRLHLHGIFFDVPFYLPASVHKSYTKMNRKLKSIWQYGNTWVGYCTDVTVGYVVKYIFKERLLTEPLKKDGTFRTNNYETRKFVSPGLGKDILTNKQIADLKAKGFLKVSLNGWTYVVPRYFRNKFLTDYEKAVFELRQFARPPSPGGSVTFKGIRFNNLESRDAYVQRLSAKYARLFPCLVNNQGRENRSWHSCLDRLANIIKNYLIFEINGTSQRHFYQKA